MRTSLSFASSSPTVSRANSAMSLMKRSRDSSPSSIRPSRCSQSPVSRRRRQRVLAEELDDVSALLGRHQRAALALDVADVDQPLDDRGARGRRADAGVLHRLAQLVVVDELAGGLHRAEQRRVRVAARRLGHLLERLDLAACARPRPDRASAAADRRRRRPRRRPLRRAPRRRRRASRARPARARGCGRRARRPWSRAACSRTRRPGGRRRGSGGRPCRRRACRRRSSCRRRCSALVGMIAWWSVTLASLTTRPSGSTSSPVTYAAARAYSRRRPTSAAVGLSSPTMSPGRKREFVRG